MEIEVGEYIRTKEGIFGKCTNKYYDSVRLELQNGEIIGTLEHDKYKHSKNIIDLIGKDDYVNNHRIKDKWYDYGNECWHLVVEGNKHIFKEDIKTILTKEQYEQNSFKL